MAPYVEFEQIPSSLPVRPTQVPTGPDYTALKTWIPGGTITQYDWSVQGEEQAYPFDIDPNRFVLLHSGPTEALDVAVSGTVALPGYSPLCLTITGTRISDYTSPPVYQPVTASVCGVTQFNVGLLPGALKGITLAPTLAAVRPGPSGQLTVTWHAPVQVDTTGSTTPNLIVHFAGEQSSSLEFLTEALKQKRSDAPTAIIVVLSPSAMTKAKYVPGISYSDDVGTWQKALQVQAANSPLTLVMNPRGGIAWQQQGVLDAQTLAPVLAKSLVKRGPVPVGVVRPNLRIGQPVPNFLFEYTAGREMPIRKLAGKPLVLVFWQSVSKPSIQAVRDLQVAAAKKKAKPMLLAINDGDSPDVARNVAAEAGLTATLVVDPNREISKAYGVKLWPTVVRVNASGTITGIESGYHSEAHVPKNSKQSVSAR